MLCCECVCVCVLRACTERLCTHSVRVSATAQTVGRRASSRARRHRVLQITRHAHLNEFAPHGPASMWVRTLCVHEPTARRRLVANLSVLWLRARSASADRGQCAKRCLWCFVTSLVCVIANQTVAINIKVCATLLRAVRAPGWSRF